MLGPAQRNRICWCPSEHFALEEGVGHDPFRDGRIQSRGVEPAAAPHQLYVNAIPEPDIAKRRRVKVVMEGGAMGGLSRSHTRGTKLQPGGYQSHSTFQG